MEVRTKARITILLLAVAAIGTGCGYTQQQARFRTAFLPSGAEYASAVDFSDPPSAPQPNPFLSKDVPGFLTANRQISELKAQADALAQQADRRFQRGKRYYQAGDMPSARLEFDAAVDSLLDALELNPADRRAYQALLDSMVDSIHRYDLAGLGASATVQADQFDEAPFEDILEMTFPVDPKLKDLVREQVAATVSQLPLSVNDAVLGYIHYFSTKGKKTLIAGLRRSGRYKAMIQRILDEEGVPQDLIRLAQAESGFIPRAVSRMKAGGMWQFLAWRGQEYGLMRTVYADDRMDPEKATRAAARHLRDLYAEFGDWYLAIAAYNCGPVNVEKAVEHTGYADFWELRARGVLPAETTNYVPIIVAMAIMEKNAAAYGIENIDFDPPAEYDTVELAAVTSLALVSDITETPLTELTALNPSLLKTVAPAGYALHVPKGEGTQISAVLQLIPADHRDAWRLHTVGPGETLTAIAQRYGTKADTVVAVNSIDPGGAVEGDRILIPVTRPPAPAKKTVAAKKPVVRKTTATAASKPAAAKTATAKAPASTNAKTAAASTAKAKAAAKPAAASASKPAAAKTSAAKAKSTAVRPVTSAPAIVHTASR